MYNNYTSNSIVIENISKKERNIYNILIMGDCLGLIRRASAGLIRGDCLSLIRGDCFSLIRDASTGLIRNA